MGGSDWSLSFRRYTSCPPPGCLSIGTHSIPITVGEKKADIHIFPPFPQLILSLPPSIAPAAFRPAYRNRPLLSNTTTSRPPAIEFPSIRLVYFDDPTLTIIMMPTATSHKTSSAGRLEKDPNDVTRLSIYQVS